jgi:hypothetical protein
METAWIYPLIAAAALAFSAAAFAWRLRTFRSLALPKDQAAPKGKPGLGILYAYTLGMAPWAKESTRRHLAAYLRGVAFHLGIFLGLGILVASPWLGAVPGSWKSILAGGAFLGALLGLSGFATRVFERNLKALSTRDDYAAVLLVSLFLGSAGLWLVVPPALPVFYLFSAALLVYAPFGKIRHCIYYAYSRLFFGRFFGARAVLPHGQQIAR